MTETFDQRLDRLLRLFERNVICEREFGFDVVRLAAYREFYSRIEDIPDEITPKLREAAAHAEPHPEDIAIATTSVFVSDEAFIEWDQITRYEYYWGSRRLREYYTPELPQPKFIPERMIGVIESVEWIDEELTLLGNFDYWFVRDHPTTARGENVTIPIEFVDNAYVKRGNYKNSDDFPVRRSGYPGIVVKTELWGKIESGFRVWVNRNAAVEPIPPENRT